MLAPGLVVLATVAVAGAFVAFDPNRASDLPSCPFHALTGWDCPGCGSLRALHALVHGDVPLALDHNVLTVLALPLLAAAWVAWVRLRLRDRPWAWVIDARLVRGIAVLFVAFAIVRNLPGVPYLGSQVG